MKVSVQKTGDSLTLPIPPEIAAESHLEPGSVLDVSVRGGQLVLKPVQTTTLEELVSRMTPENRHEETDWGPRVGREIL